MPGKTNLSNLMKRLSPQLNDGEYVFATVLDSDGIDREDTILEFKEREGITIVIEKIKKPYEINSSRNTRTF